MFTITSEINAIAVYYFLIFVYHVKHKFSIKQNVSLEDIPHYVLEHCVLHLSLISVTLYIMCIDLYIYLYICVFISYISVHLHTFTCFLFSSVLFFAFI